MGCIADAQYNTGAECKGSKSGGYYAVQCLPPEGYAQDVCAYGADNCCDPSCVPAANAFNDLRDTPSLSFQASTDMTITESCQLFTESCQLFTESRQMFTESRHLLTESPQLTLN
jgi:hypothetical protein